MARYNPPTVIVQGPNDSGGGAHPLAYILLVGAILLGALLIEGALRPQPEPEPVAVTPPTPTLIEQASAEAIQKDAEMDMREREFKLARTRAWAQQVDTALVFAGNFALGIGLGALAAGTVLALLRTFVGPQWRERLWKRRARAAPDTAAMTGAAVTPQAAHAAPTNRVQPMQSPIAPVVEPATIYIYVSGDGHQPGQTPLVKYRRQPDP